MSPFSFPADLERVIFEITGICWPRSIPKLLLVACRVKAWIEPLLYRTIIVADHRQHLRDPNRPPVIESSVLVSLIHAKQFSFFRNSARNLMLSHSPIEEEAVILSACSGVENLWITSERLPLIPRLAHLRLKQLHCIFDTAFTFNHPLFTQITHLEIFDTSNTIEPKNWSGLAQIRHLTHLAFNYTGIAPVCPSLLRTCESLRVLCILFCRARDIERAGIIGGHVSELKEDPRFVVMVCAQYIEDWIDGAHTGNDYWARADDFVAKRRSGEINPLEYYLKTNEANDT